MTPQTGDVLLLDKRAAAEFAAHPIVYSVVAVEPAGGDWVWLDGYELDANGKALDRRAVWVHTASVPRARL